MLALTETKQKGKGDVSRYGVSSINVGVLQTERAWEGVAVSINGVWNSGVMDFGSFGKFKFSKFKICVVLVYGPTEGDFEEKEVVLE